MLAGFLLALREGIEAALIVGIVLGVLRKTGRLDRARVAWVGVAAASAVSVLGALALNRIGTEFEGPGEQAFEGLTMLLAAGILTWMVFWMRAQGRSIQRGLEAEVNRALTRGQQWALFSLTFFAVVREGLELALFLTAAGFPEAGATTNAALSSWTGGVLGLAAAVVVGWLLFATTVRLNLGRFFATTSVLLVLFAAGLVGHGIHELNELGWIQPIVEHVYDLGAVLPEEGLVGQFMKALFGYNADPSLSEMLGYASYFAVVAAFIALGDLRGAATKRIPTRGPHRA